MFESRYSKCLSKTRLELGDVLLLIQSVEKIVGTEITELSSSSTADIPSIMS